MALTITMTTRLTILGTFTTSQQKYYIGMRTGGEDNDVWLDLGRSRWEKQSNFIEPFKHIKNFQKDYEVSYCDGIWRRIQRQY